MEFEELISIHKDFGMKKTDVIVIIPFYKNYDALFKHLELLSQQTYQDFNVVLVLNIVSDDRKIVDFILKNDFKFGIAVVKRIEDTGCSGGFFTGEKYAIENGYSIVVLADDDCMPEDNDLLAELVQFTRRKGICAARVKLRAGPKTWREGGSMHMYGAMRVELLKKTGLHFVPLYIGADDSEFSTRFSVTQVPRIDRWASHPYTHSIFADFRRSVLYRINHMIFWGLTLDWRRLLTYLYSFMVHIPAYLMLGSPAVKKGGLHILGSVLGMRYGKPALDSFEHDVEYGMPPTDASTAGITEGNKIIYKGGLLGKLRFAWRVLLKEVVLEPMPNFGIIMSMLLARRVWVKTAKGTYVLADNRNILFHIIKLVIYYMLGLPLVIAGLISIPFVMLRKPRTMGYGLE